MGEWEMVRLGDVCTVVNGFAYDSKKFNVDRKGMPLIRIRDVIRGFSETWTTETYKKEHVIHKDDLLVGMDGEFNIALWNTENALLNQRVCKIDVNSNAVCKKYIYYFLPIKLKEIENKTAFVTVKHLSSKTIKDIYVPLPPISIQQKIADVLDRASALIDKSKAQIDKLDLLIKSQFIEMFGDPVTNPMGWEVKKLSELCKIYRGGSPRPISKYLGGNIPWIKIGDASNGDNIYLHSTHDKIIKEGIGKSKLVKEGSLIFANCGVSLGFARIIKFDGCIHDGWLAFEEISQKLDKVFLLNSLNFCTCYFRSIAPEGTQPNLNISIMKKHNQICPPFSLQREFGRLLANTQNEKVLLNHSLAQLEQNYQSLMQKCFRGEIF